MNVSEFHSAVLQLAVEDHEIISKLTEAISRMFASKSEAGLKKAIQAITKLTNQKVLKHFAYEEAKVFAPLLADRPDRKTIKLVTVLEAEHKSLLQQIRRLERTLTTRSLPGQASVLWKALMRFLDKFEDHANKENEFFHFLLDGIPAKRPVKRLTKRPAKRAARR